LKHLAAKDYVICHGGLIEDKDGAASVAIEIVAHQLSQRE
jgi:hypothetical protein